MDLSTQTNYISLVIQLQKQRLNYQALKNWVASNCSLWAYIVHDKDKYEDGTLKGKHIHVKMILNSDKRPRLSTTLNTLTKELKIDKNAIQIEKMDSISGSIQYLIHLNDSDKHQYKESEIVTNLTEKELHTYLYAYKESDEIDAQRLIDICTQQNHSKIGIMLTLGLRNYTKLRGPISDICYELELKKFQKQ